MSNGWFLRRKANSAETPKPRWLISQDLVTRARANLPIVGHSLCWGLLQQANEHYANAIRFACHAGCSGHFGLYLSVGA